MEKEIIIGIKHGVIDNAMIDYEPDQYQCVKLVLMNEQGFLREVTTTLDHKAKNFIVTDGPAKL